MEMRKTSLSKFFIIYTIKVILIPVCILIAFWILLTAGFMTEVIRPANYEQGLVEQIAPVLEEADEITSDLIPFPLEYALFDNDNHQMVDAGNMKDSSLEEASRYLNHNIPPSGLGNPTFRIIQGKHRICILRYSITPKFTSPELQKLVPYPEVFMLIICGGVFLITMIIISRRTAGSFIKEINKILKSTEKIKEQDLDFHSETNRFVELHAVSESLDSLRDALKLSLNEQIEIEQNKTEQIRSLAHDIKIPITIIKGNAELLSLQEQDEGNQEITDDIVSASDQIESYVGSLIDTLSISSAQFIQKEAVDLQKFIESLQKEAESITRAKGCSLTMQNSIEDKRDWNMDAGLMTRAILNVLNNGVQHTKQGNSISLKLEIDKEEYLRIEIQDSGKGFSKEALAHSKELFFTENEARIGEQRGIGLHFTNKVLESHGGTLELKNTEKGGLVILKIPE